MSKIQAKKSDPSSTSTTNIPSSMSVPNPKIEHMLKHWFFVSGPDHKIWLMFQECDIDSYEKFIGYDKQIILDMRHKKKNQFIPLNNRKIKMINDVLLYYNFMRKNKDNMMAENPDQWVMEDFNQWRNGGFPISTAVCIVSLARTTTTTTSLLVASVTKKAEDELMSWRCGNQDPTLYPILENDNTYTDWIIKMVRQFKKEECEQVIDENFKDNQMVCLEMLTMHYLRLKRITYLLFWRVYSKLPME